jgi:hypothetical protein
VGIVTESDLLKMLVHKLREAEEAQTDRKASKQT